MATKPNNAKIVETCTRRVRSLDSYVESNATIAVNGRKLAHADVVATYQRCLDARATVARLRAQLEDGPRRKLPSFPGRRDARASAP